MSHSYNVRYQSHCLQRHIEALHSKEAQENGKRMDQAAKNASADLNRKYPGGITSDNAGEVLEYQRSRILHWQQQLGAA